MNASPSRARRALVVLGAAAVAGCSITRPAPVKNQFLLAPPAPPAAAQPKPAALRVGSVNVAAPFRTKTFVYRESDLRYVSDYYTEFLVPPGTMIAEATARALSQARVFSRVALPGAPQDADYVLDGFVEALYGDARNAAKPSADLSITYYLSRADEASPFWSKTYGKSVPLSSNSTDQYAAALSTAFGDILAELARDLAAVDLRK
jgi:uncharacterized lipoprotein YmbA